MDTRQATAGGSAVRAGPLRLAWVALAAVWLGASVLAWSRVLEVRRLFGQINRCIDCLDPAVLAADAPWLLLPLVAVSMHWWLRRRWLLPLWVLLAVLWPVLLTADVAVMHTVSRRLLLSDLVKYASDWSIAGQVGVSSLGSGVAGLALALLALMAGSLLLLAVRPTRALALATAASAAIGTLGAQAVADPGYVIPGSHHSLVAVNWPHEARRPYAEPQAAAWKALAGMVRQDCADERPARIDSAIVLVVESLSQYHLGLGPRSRPLAPGLLQLARAGAWAEEFHANGFTTDGGLISVITGEVPYPPPDGHGVFEWYQAPSTGPRAYLPRLHAAGIRTQYFGSSDLGFLNKGRWLQGLGFDRVEGSEQPFYEGLPRGSFHAADDDALFRRYLHWLDHERPARFVSVMLTTTMHPPFLVPATGELDEAAAVRHTDAALAAFVKGLSRRGFFERGLLFITGDHRSMTPRLPGEWEQLGEGYRSRVPALWLGGPWQGQGEVKGRWQQTDVMPSLLEALGVPGCLDAAAGRLFAPTPKPPRHVIHAAGDLRDEVLVWLQGQSRPERLRLAAEDSHWTRAPADADGARRALAAVHAARATSPAERAAPPALAAPVTACRSCR